MIEITSTTNQIVKDTVKLHQKKYRDEFILIEGKKATEEAIAANLEIKYIFSKEKKEYKNFETVIVNDAILKKISTTDTEVGVAAVAKRPKYSLDKFKEFKKIVLLDGIKDAGNLGTIIRAASAFGVEGIMLFNETVDEFSPKTIRAAAGNIFKTPIAKINMEKLREFKKTHRFISLVCHSNNYFNGYKMHEPSIILFGSEADGLCKDLLNLSDEEITIKLSNNVESLNLAMTAVIVLYELQKG